MSQEQVTDVHVFDVHAHHFPRALPEAHIGGSPRLEVDADAVGRIMVRDTVFRKVRPPLWDNTARLSELDDAGVGGQLISPVPVMLTYADDPTNAAHYAHAVNDGLAADVAGSGGRLFGLGTVPLQDPSRAVVELERVMGELGLCGVEIGTQIDGADLDDPSLRPFFEAAESLGAAIFVHPVEGGGRAIRRTGEPYNFGLGMLTDTAMAATALVFGGVLERYPHLRICLAHGCGTFAWAYPRIRLGAHLMADVAPERVDDLVRSLWVDTLVFDPAHLALLTRRFGAGHVMFGTDYPFIPGQVEGARDFFASAVEQGAVSDVDARAMLGANTCDFVGRSQDAPSPRR